MRRAPTNHPLHTEPILLKMTLLCCWDSFVHFLEASKLHNPNTLLTKPTAMTETNFLLQYLHSRIDFQGFYVGIFVFSLCLCQILQLNHLTEGKIADQHDQNLAEKLLNTICRLIDSLYFVFLMRTAIKRIRIKYIFNNISRWTLDRCNWFTSLSLHFSF